MAQSQICQIGCVLCAHGCASSGGAHEVYVCVCVCSVPIVLLQHKTHLFSTHHEQAHCHFGALNSPWVAVQFVCTKCPPSDASECYDRTWH